MSKVLILGAKGMLGQELVRVFAGTHEVVAWDVSDIDIADESQVKEKILPLKPRIIVNAAAYNAVDKCEEPAENKLAEKINGLAPGYLARVARNLDALFVHYSTDYVFGGEKIGGYAEADVPSPLSNYGRSKLLGEQETARVGGRYFIIRLQKLFGRPAQSVAAKKSFFEIMLALARDKKEIEAVDEELANFTFASDLARQTKTLIENNVKLYPYGIYHITNEGRPLTWCGAAKVLFEMVGLSDIKVSSVPASHFPRPAKRPRYSILLNTKLPPLRSWDKALKEFLKNTPVLKK